MRLAVFIFVTVLHLVVGVIFWVFFFSMAMAAIDGEGSALGLRIAYVTLRVLFPLWALMDSSALGAAAKVTLFLGNSFIWGAVAAFAWSLYQRVLGTSRRAHVVERRGAV